MKAVALLITALIAAPAPAATSTLDRSRLLKQLLDQGLQVARRHCVACHAIGPAGPSPTPEAPAFRDLHKDYPVGDLVGAIAEGAPTGHPQMPRFRLSFADRQALIAYVRGLNR